MTAMLNMLLRYEKYMPLGLALLTLLVFSPVLGHEFVNFDDPAFVYENPVVQLGLTLEGIRWAFTSVHEANWIPLTWLSHMLDVELFGLNPAGHHAVNVIIHAVSSCLLFLFLRQTTRTTWQSLVVATLFAVHPLRVESVAWVAERKDVLSTMFWMLTLMAYLRYLRKPGAIRYLQVLCCFAIGLLAKPMLVTLPLILLILDWWPCGRFSIATDLHRPRFATFLRLLMEKIPFILLASCSCAMTYWAQHLYGETTQGYTVLSRLGKAGIAYLAYLGKMIWPVNLAVLYPFPKIPPTTAHMLSSALILFLISGVVVWMREKYPFLLAGWLWYLVSLLPVIGLIQVGQHSIADRYTYVPLVGVFIMVVWGVSQGMIGWPYRTKVLSLSAIGVVALLVILTVRQLGYWQNSYRLFSHTLAITHDNWVAHNNLAQIYFNEGRLDEAIEHYKKSIAAKPSYVLAHMNMGVAYRVKRDFQKSEEAFKWVLTFEPKNDLAVYNLGLLYLDAGTYTLATQQYQKLVALESSYASSLQAALEQIRSESETQLHR